LRLNFSALCPVFRRKFHQKNIDLNQPDIVNDKLGQGIADRNEFLEVVAEKINRIILEAKKT